MAITVGEALVDLLEQYGVQHVFGIPGTHALSLYRGLVNSQITHISPRHEQGGGFMADGYARVTGKPGVCFVITGPGVTNITTPMGEAYLDSVPMLVISPVNTPDGGKINRGHLHEITDQSAVTAPITHLSATAHRAEEVPGLLAKAFAIFNSERPGPVHLSIPLKVLAQEAGDAPWRAQVLPGKPGATQVQLASSQAFLSAAKKPVLVVGGGARFEAEQVQALAERWGIPVITTVAARGVLPPEHPLCVGSQLRAAPARGLLAESDLAIFLGTEFAQTDHYTPNIQLPSRQIRVNLNPNALHDENAEVIGIRGDCGDWLSRMLAVAPQASVDGAAAEARIQAVKDAVPASMTDKDHQHTQVLQAMMQALPSNATVVSDMTQLAYTAVDYLPMPKANQWHHPTGYGTLGYGLPAAIGAAIAQPGEPVLAIAGDAGVQYTQQEMTLAAELNLPLVLLLWDNTRLQQIYDDMVGANYTPIAVQQRNPDFQGLAKACGWQSREVDQLADITTVLQEAFACKAPVLVQVHANALY